MKKNDQMEAIDKTFAAMTSWARIRLMQSDLKSIAQSFAEVVAGMLTLMPADVFDLLCQMKIIRKMTDGTYTHIRIITTKGCNDEQKD